MELIIDLCRNYPQIPIFLAIALGYYVGKLKFFGMSLGSTASVLLVALALGQMGIEVPELLQSIGFALFIFAIGYRVGPQFFGALRKEGIHYIWIALVVAVTGLVTAVFLGRVFGFDPGMTAGLLGGAMTQSTVIGTADGAIKGLLIPASVKAAWRDNVAVAYAITYIFGVVGLILFYKFIPGLLKIDLRADARELERKMSDGGAELEGKPELFSWYKSIGLRAYRIRLSGKKVLDLEKMLPGRVVVEKVKRGDQLLDPSPDLMLESGDEVALAGERHAFLEAERVLGEEIDDRGVIDIMGEILTVCVLNKEVVGRTLGEISNVYGHKCFLRKLVRQDHEIPLTRGTVVHKCDLLQIAGSARDVERFANYLGYPERSTAATDLIMVALGCMVGTLIGLIAIPIAGIPVTLGVGGGVLVAGLACGWLRTVHPTFGQIPAGAQWIFTDLGLNLFIACVGLTAAPKAVQALQTSGGAVFLAGVILTLMPAVVGLLFGRWVLKLDPLLLFGALTGAETATPSLNVVKEESNSAFPALGYAVPFAFGNVILTIWGTVIIHLMQAWR